MGPGLVLFFWHWMALLAFANPSYITFPSDIDWVTRKSPHFEILYRKGQGELAKKSLESAERAHQLLAPIFPETPPHTWIVLSDFSDSTNGYALNFPFPHMVLFAAPPSASGTLANLDDWLDSVILHEYVHILHLYPAHGLWSPLRSIFGSIIVPNGLMPSHLHEGLAVLLETELTGGGRGRSALWKMYRRKAVEAGKWGDDFVPLDLLDGSPTDWPHGRSPYFFGYYFYKQLWDNFGREGVKKLTLAASSNWPYFIQAPYSESFGMDYSTIWEKTYEATKKEASKELKAIGRSELAPLKYLTQSRYSKWDLSLSPDGKLLAYRTGRPDERSQIKIADAVTGKTLHKMDTRPQGEGICWGTYRKKSQLLYTERRAGNGYNKAVLTAAQWDGSELDGISLKGKGIERVHTLACSDDLQHVWTYEEKGGDGQLVHYSRSGPPSEIQLKEVARWQVPASSWISSISVSENGTWFALRTDTRTLLYEWEREGPLKRWTYPGHLFGLRATGRDRLVGIWDRDERYEGWEISLKDGQVRKAIGVVGGLISVVPHNKNWLVSSYEHGGYDLAQTSPKFSAYFPPPEAAPSKRKPTSIIISEERSYSPWSTLLPRTWIPNFLFVPDGAQISAYVPVFDISQRHYYTGYLGYDTRGSAFGSVGYSHRFHETSALGMNAYFSPSYIISNKLFLTRWGASTSLSTRIKDWSPNYSVQLLFNKLENSPGISGTPRRNIGIGLGVGYALDAIEAHPLEVTPRWGTTVTLNYQHFLKAMGSDDNYFSVIGGLDQYFPAPWMEGHGFYLRSRAGFTQGTSLVNSFFEGGGELAFSQGRSTFQNRGFFPGTFFARRIFNASLEYRFPLFRVDRGVGTLPLFLYNFHAALVADVTTSDYGTRYAGDSATLNNARRHLFKVFYGSYGLELKTHTKLGFYLPTGIRLGLYRPVASFDLATGTNGTPVSRAPSIPDLYFVLGIDVALL